MPFLLVDAETLQLLSEHNTREAARAAAIVEATSQFRGDGTVAQPQPDGTFLIASHDEDDNATVLWWARYDEADVDSLGQDREALCLVAPSGEALKALVLEEFGWDASDLPAWLR